MAGNEFSFTTSVTPNNPKHFHLEDIKEERTSHKRQLAANFIESLLGPNIRIPTHTDEAFRSVLADGVILCKILNIISPGSIPHIVDDQATSPTSSARQQFENVANFIKASHKLTTETFSAADLEENGDVSQVVECILSLQDRFHHSLLHSPTASHQMSTPLPSALVQNNSGFTPHAVDLVHKHSDQQDGLSYLMQACTQMLKSRMGVPVTPPPLNTTTTTTTTTMTNPEIALDAVGPVLETVLSNLTSDYEKRLLDKDREQKHLIDTVARLQEELLAVKKDAEEWKNKRKTDVAVDDDSKAMLLKTQERVEYERLIQAEKSLVCELAAKRREIEALQADSSSQLATANNQVSVLRTEIEKYREIHNKYKTLQAENRSLYNIVQDLRGNIRVFCRIRPRGITGDPSSSIVEVGEDGKLAVYSHKHSKWHEFAVDRVFGEQSTQSEIYDETKPLVRSVLDGYNVCIFCYGQTGSGKTYTMSGDGSGINTRALHDLFEQRDERTDEVQYTIRVQLLEVYNENVRDLLAVGDDVHRSLNIVSTLGSGANVPDATTVEVCCAEDVEMVMERGAKNRATAETKMNDRSSRSHQVLTVLVNGVDLTTRTTTFGCLNLIDLAGSERVARSGAQGKQLLEAQHINKSLTALGCVMQALAQKRSHVPFRDSKLTQLLQDSLAGQAKSMMFIHIAPESSSVSETLSTLHFGKQVTEITLGAAQRNTESGQVWELREMFSTAQREAVDAKKEVEVLRSEVESLKKQIDGYVFDKERMMRSGSGRDIMKDKNHYYDDHHQIKSADTTTKADTMSNNNSSSGGMQIGAYRPMNTTTTTTTTITPPPPTMRTQSSTTKIPTFGHTTTATTDKHHVISSHGSNMSGLENDNNNIITPPLPVMNDDYFDDNNMYYSSNAAMNTKNTATLGYNDDDDGSGGAQEGFVSLAAAAAHALLPKSKSLSRSNSGIGGGIARVYSRRESGGWSGRRVS